MKELCIDCQSLFRNLPPKDSYSLYQEGKCEGCLKTTLITNPRFYLKVVEKKTHEVCVSTAYLPYTEKKSS